ncbi:MAG: Asp-tRNA(Asn)/Glu-tRNA(Gln) amidotransferase subunit GatB [Candidatus Nanopelagicales bacterium]
MNTAIVNPEFATALQTYKPVLGFEVHVELSTKSKMFCGCPTDFGAAPNTHVCPTCVGLPGSLPVVNQAAVEATIKIGLALNCEIAAWCRFARKNYFYPDMPKDYQISQYDEPLCSNGYLDVDVVDDAGEHHSVRVEIERVHMEEDTGKLLHTGGDTGRIQGADYSLVDYNRAGVPLIEIVTKTIEGTGELAPEVGKAYVTQLRELVRSLGVSDVRMEQGSLRCDANVSLMLKDATEWGTRTETKNVNSLRSVERAIRSEIIRQASVLDAGGTIIQETRHFQESTGDTTSGREKSDAEDYRYFPEPDLIPIAADPEWVELLRAGLPEAPGLRVARLQQEWELTDFEMASIVNSDALDLVVATVEAGAEHTSARKWWLGELTRIANNDSVALDSLEITPAQVARVAALVDEGALNDKLARKVIEGVLAGEGDPDEVVASRGLAVVSDDGPLIAAIDEAIAANPDVVEKITGGKPAAAGVIVGSVMKATRGQADAGRVRELLFAKLGVTE